MHVHGHLGCVKGVVPDITTSPYFRSLALLAATLAESSADGDDATGEWGEGELPLLQVVEVLDTRDNTTRSSSKGNNSYEPSSLPTMAMNDHHHPTGHTPKVVSPQLETQCMQAKPVPTDIASKEHVTPEGATDAHPKVDRVFTLTCNWRSGS